MRNKDFSNKCFLNALIELSKTKDFEEIQIQEICYKAGFNRSTFYRSYTSKIDILVNEFEKGLVNYQKLVDNNKNCSFIDKTKLLFDLIKDSSEIMLLMHKAGLDNQIYDSLYDIYPIKSGYEEKYGKYYKPFRTAGVYKTIMEWITSGMKETSLEMANLLADIMNNCNADY